MEGERLVGFLVFQEIEGQRFFRIETPSRGWVGDVDGYGRFYKCEPFREKPRELGIYTMKAGLALLLETREPLRILPLEGRGEASEAAAHRLLKQARGDRDGEL